MADAPIQAQSIPSGGTLADLYTATLAMEVVSSITVCNQNSFDVTFRISVALLGAADTLAQYRYYDTPLAANDTFVATIGATLAATDKIRVRSDRGGVSFAVDGVKSAG